MNQDIEIIKEHQNYFYSKQQEERFVQLNKKYGREYKPQEVMVNGEWKKFTERTSKDKIFVTDAKLVTSGQALVIKKNTRL